MRSAVGPTRARGRAVVLQALYYRRETFDRLGGYDTAYRICADYDLLLRAVVLHRVSSRHVGRGLVFYPVNGLSARPECVALAREERAAIQARHLPADLHAEHQAWLEARRRSPAGRLRAAARPLARTLRRIGRRLRGRTDEGSGGR
jgi:hypothetical protein